MKYKITEESIVHKGHVLWRIVHRQTLEKGGWIQHEKNLSQLGESWVSGEAKVYEQAVVLDDACVSDYAEVFGEAEVRESAQIYGNAQIYDQAIVEGFTLVYDAAEVYGKARVQGNVELYGDAVIKSDRRVNGAERIFRQEATWEDVDMILSLKIFTAGGLKEATLYGNGRHQVALHVSLIAKDANGNGIILPQQEIFKHIEFVDYKNVPLTGDFEWSDEPGEYYYPIPRVMQREPNASVGVFYVSTHKRLHLIDLCVKCMVHKKVNINGNIVNKVVEYTTAFENNNGEAIPDAVLLEVLKERIFHNNDIDVEKRENKGVNSTNSILTKYYVKFSSSANTEIKKAVCEEGVWFYYKQKGNYKAFATSTDASYALDFGAEYTAEFEVTKNTTITITSTNHDAEGLCFWTYRQWKGTLWSYNVWDEIVLFSLFDKYGNEAKIAIQVNKKQTALENDAHLSFVIVHS
ncbi:hypothetical protein ACKUSY_02375 [Myroides odoratus]